MIVIWVVKGVWLSYRAGFRFFLNVIFNLDYSNHTCTFIGKHFWEQNNNEFHFICWNCVFILWKEENYVGGREQSSLGLSSLTTFYWIEEDEIGSWDDEDTAPKERATGNMEVTGLTMCISISHWGNLLNYLAFLEEIWREQDWFCTLFTVLAAEKKWRAELTGPILSWPRFCQEVL